MEVEARLPESESDAARGPYRDYWRDSTTELVDVGTGVNDEPKVILIF
jgi:hypothetical protein